MNKPVKCIRCSICKNVLEEDEAEYNCGDLEHPLCHGCSVQKIRGKDGN